MRTDTYLRTALALALAVALLAACVAPAAAPAPTSVPAEPTPVPPEVAAPDLFAVVQAWADAIYSGDVDAALSYFTDDGNYLLHYTARGKEEMRWVFNWLAGLETKQENFDCQAGDDKLTCTYTVLDGCMAASGSAGLPVTATFTFRDSKIKEAAGRTVSGPEWDGYWKFVGIVQSWERAFRPEEMAKIVEGTKEGGAIAIKLCREYETIVKTQAPKTAAAAQAWADAINSGDVDAAMALFTGETAFTFWKDTSKGEEQVRAMFDWLVGKETLYQITNCEWQATGFQCDMTAVDGCIAASGDPDGVRGKLTFFSHEDGTLKSVSGVLIVTDRKAYQTWLDAEHAWAASAHADELAQAEGYSKPAGAMMVKLCREYATVSDASGPDVAAPARAWMEAINAGDVDAALALVSDNVKFRFGGEGGTGPVMMGGHLNWWAGIDTKYHILDCQAEGERVLCNTTIADGCIAVSGYPDGLPMKIEFVVGSDGKINEITGPTVGEQWDAYWKQVGSAQTWFRAYRAEEIAKNDWSRAFGPTMVRLCNEWAAARQTQPPATEAAAYAWVDAINSGDVDAAMALYTGETAFTFWQDSSKGEEQVRAMFDWLVGKETQYQITNCEWQGTGTKCDMTAVDGCIAASGVPDGVHGKLTFNSHEDGTLKSVGGVLLVTDRRAYQTWLDAEHAWAASAHADELAQAEGYSKLAGAMAVKLCREYAETLK